ncbi:MAG: cupredoxin domain-containing protein [Actinomycetota bacterium]|nr:cupredoxin domain-containing protein [Actinomycetota bacterium]
MSFEARLLVAAGGPLAAGLALIWTTPWRRDADHRPARAQQRRIIVRAGYNPSEVHVDAGSPILLVFQRQETSACSERVVFPGLGISATLPAFAETTLELPAVAVGTYPFTCEMEMLHGELIADPPAARVNRVSLPPCAPAGASDGGQRAQGEPR